MKDFLKDAWGYVMSLSGKTKLIILLVTVLVIAASLKDSGIFYDLEGEIHNMRIDSERPAEHGGAQAYIEAVEKKDFEEAHNLLNMHLSRYVEAVAQDNWDSDKAASEFWAAANHIYKAEIQHLLPMNDEAANLRVIHTLQSMNAPGTRPTKEIVYEYGYDDEEAYAFFVEKYNRLCDEILGISITAGNEDMAKKIVKLYKDEFIKRAIKKKVVLPDVGEMEVSNYVFEESSASKESAKARLQEAIDDGSFE